MEFVADGSALFTVSQGIAHVWSTENGDEIDRLPDAESGMLSGSYAVTASSGRGLRRRLIESKALIAAACARLERGIAREKAAEVCAN